MGDLWTVFCGGSGCSDSSGKPCSTSFEFLSHPSSCINHIMIIGFDVLLLVMLIFNMVQKSSSKTVLVPSRFQGFSNLQIASAIFNGCVGCVYLFFGIWNLEEKLRKTKTALPLGSWLLQLFQGFTWLLVSLTVSLKGKKLPRAPLRLLCILAFLFSGIVGALSLFGAILSKEVSIKVALDILSCPGAILLLFCTYKGYNYEESDESISESSLYTPLNGEANDISKSDSAGLVTPFAKAGFFCKISFWWLNSLMKKGREKTLEDEDIPKLREADQAESCYLLFLEQLNKQKQKEPSSQPSILNNLYVSIPMVCLAIRLQGYYFSSAKEFMRINGTTKSFVANHLAESLAGAMTIRAFEEEDRFFAKNLDLIDTNASPSFYSFAANEWLIQRLEILSATVLASAALCMVLLPPGTFSSGFIGMALSYGLSLNMSLVFSIQNQCTLANYIISVERLNQYMYIPSEAPEVIEVSRPPTNWPSVGKVEIHDLQIRYRPDAPLVLRGISCTFKEGHKIGIVGRTGSGKTTLVGALFRLVEPAGGKIIVDGIDISMIGLHDLRSRFGIIPQEPTLFNGTVRYNLDPLSQHSDKEIWEVLEKCQLDETVKEKEKGLDSLVVEDGSNWSQGQRQLFCLGRALLRRSRILVLDEATASIDNATDMILQRTIRTEFADCTVITVAHRIPTVMDCTMVLAISDGKLMEYDEPMTLMKREGSLFGQLVKEYWSHSQSAESHSI